MQEIKGSKASEKKTVQKKEMKVRNKDVEGEEDNNR